MQYDPYKTAGGVLPRCYGNTSYAENTMLWFENRWFVRFDLEKLFQWWGGEMGKWEKKDWQWKRGRKEIQCSDSVWRKLRVGEREMRQGLTCSNWQQCFRQFGSLLSLYFYKESRNTSSAIHFISIPTPSSHLHSVSFASTFHFSTCHYISWMITYWQFLHWHSTDQDMTPPASKAGRFPPPQNLLFSSFSSSLTVKSQFQPVTPPQTLDQIQIFALWPLRDLVQPSDSPGTTGWIVCLASPQQQMNQALNSYPD